MFVTALKYVDWYELQRVFIIPVLQTVLNSAKNCDVQTKFHNVAWDYKTKQNKKRLETMS